MRRTPDGARTDVLPEGCSARTRAHEYGGGAWAVDGGCVVFVDFDDQRVKRLDLGSSERRPTPLSPEPASKHALRYADLAIDRAGGQVLAVREQHLESGDVVNDLVALPLDGSDADRGLGRLGGRRGRRLLRLADAVSPIDDTWRSSAGTCRTCPGTPPSWWCSNAKPGRRSSSPGETRSRWWPPSGCPTARSSSRPTGPAGGTRTAGTPVSGAVRALAPVDGEIGGGLWVFGLRYLAWMADGRCCCSLTSGGFDRLALATGDGSPPTILDTPFTHISQVVAGPDDTVVVVAGTPVDESAPYRVSIDGAADGAVHVERLRPPRDLGLGAHPARWFSVPEAVEVATTDDATTHALVYPPTNPEVAAAEADTLPPLLVLTHGGPTSAAPAQLNLTIQFWTSRGFCVADVNYRGSTGYGRTYRDALKGRWGIADVEDCVAVARQLAADGVVDPARLAIRGGSAGGFTTLAALTFHDTFTAGASSYGIADLEVLATDTHKFEARYLDSLVGPWPADAATYQDRSPIHHLGQLSCPVAVFQGALDEVVPPSQATMVVEAMQRNGLPYAAVTFDDEGHGFRRAENIVRALEGELWFFSRAFDLALDEDIEPLPGQGLADS